MCFVVSFHQGVSLPSTQNATIATSVMASNSSANLSNASNANANAIAGGNINRKDSGTWMFFDVFCNANDVYASVVENFSVLLTSSNVQGEIFRLS